MTDYGLTRAGFNPMRQADCITDLQQGFIGKFGQNVNLDDSSVFGQIVGIMAERHALLWEALQDTYNSQYPSGAEGVSVDNLLSLIGIQKLTASSTKTDPSPLTQANGIVLNGLVLYGAPGTVIPQGSIVQTSATPPAQFTLDAPVTIGPAINAYQQVLFSNAATQGTYALTLGVPSGSQVTTAPLPFGATAQRTLIAFGGTPTQGSYVLSLGGANTVALPYDASAESIQTAIRALGYGGASVSGMLSTGFAITWPAGFQPYVSANATVLTFGGMPTSGSFQLSFNGANTAPIPFSASLADIQTSVIALTGARNLVLSGAVGSAITFAWGQPTAPAFTGGTNGVGVSLIYSATNTVNTPVNVTNSVQASINQIIDPGTGLMPFTDVAVTPISGGLGINFGANTPLDKQPSSGATPEPTILVASNSLQANTALTNIAVINAQSGQPALGLGSATCTEQGPTIVAAGALNQIGTPITGWNGVTNQLDALPGSLTETDTEALARRATLLSTRANGPLDALVQQVRQVTGVTAALGFANLRTQAQQTLSFSSVPSSGSYMLIVKGDITAAIPASAGPSQVQAALQALPGLEPVQVSGTVAFGLTVDFNGALGGQAIPLMGVVQNTTGVAITPRYGRPGKSVELVVQGGKNVDVATAIFDNIPAGIIAYGSPIAITTASYKAGEASITVANATNIATGQAIHGQGIRAGTVVGAVAGTNITLSQPAIATYTGSPVYTSTTVSVLDANGNPQLISFTRPQPVPIYVNVTLVTDLYNVAGNQNSGVNPYAKFSPSSASVIQSNIIGILNDVPIGGTIVAMGTQGLIGAFNGVPGVSNYSLTFGASSNPTSSSNLQLQPQQVASAQTFNISISYV